MPLWDQRENDVSDEDEFMCDDEEKEISVSQHNSSAIDTDDSWE